MDTLRTIIANIFILPGMIALIYFGYRLYKQKKSKENTDSKVNFTGVIVAVVLLAIGGSIAPESAREKAREEARIANEEQRQERERQMLIAAEEKKVEDAKYEKEQEEKRSAIAKQKEEERLAMEAQLTPTLLRDNPSNEDFTLVVNYLIGEEYKGKPRVEESFYSPFDTIDHVMLKLRGAPSESSLLADSLKILKGLKEYGYDGRVAFFWIDPDNDTDKSNLPSKMYQFTISNEVLANTDLDNISAFDLPELAEEGSHYRLPKVK